MGYSQQASCLGDSDGAVREDAKIAKRLLVVKLERGSKLGYYFQSQIGVLGGIRGDLRTTHGLTGRVLTSGR